MAQLSPLQAGGAWAAWVGALLCLFLFIILSLEMVPSALHMRVPTELQSGPVF